MPNLNIYIKLEKDPDFKVPYLTNKITLSDAHKITICPRKQNTLQSVLLIDFIYAQEKLGLINIFSKCFEYKIIFIYKIHFYHFKLHECTKYIR